MAATYWSSMASHWARSFSPYQFNPFNLNPLLALLGEHVDFEALRSSNAPRLFVSATEVSTGRLRLFSNSDITASAVMASACLPQLFHAVEIDAEVYWDGGYVANPALAPLVSQSAPEDILIIQLKPLTRSALPKTAGDIAARVNEGTFNSSLVQELQGLAQLKRALEEEPAGHVFQNPLFNRVKALRLHRIVAEEEHIALNARQALDPEWAFLLRLRHLGVQAAESWLKAHRECLGARSTLALEDLM